MMDIVGLFEMDSSGDFFTWSNKQTDNVIYSRIDRILGNITWLQQHIDSTITIMPPNISGHAMLFLKGKDHISIFRSSFKYINNLSQVTGFHDAVYMSWNITV